MGGEEAALPDDPACPRMDVFTISAGAPPHETAQ
jgi:hypothetical protein